MYKEALEKLIGAQEIVVRSENGKTQRHAKYMSDSDWIERSRQASIFNI